MSVLKQGQNSNDFRLTRTRSHAPFPPFFLLLNVPHLCQFVFYNDTQCRFRVRETRNNAVVLSYRPIEDRPQPFSVLRLERQRRLVSLYRRPLSFESHEMAIRHITFNMRELQSVLRNRSAAPIRNAPGSKSSQTGCSIKPFHNAGWYTSCG